MDTLEDFDQVLFVIVVGLEGGDTWRKFLRGNDLCTLVKCLKNGVVRWNLTLRDAG